MKQYFNKIHNSQNSGEKILSVTSWMVMTWQDDRLKFIKENRGLNLKYFHIGSELIWTPDIALYNSDISSGIGTCHIEDCMVYPSGRVACV